MKPDDLEYLSVSLRKVVRSEIRVAAVLDMPSVNPPPADLPAEDQIIAAAREGHFVEGFDARWFSRPFCTMVYVVLEEAHKLGIDPTPERVETILLRDGWRGSGLREELTRMFDHVGFCRPDIAAIRVGDAARRRTICQLAQQLDAESRTWHSDETMAATLHKLAGELGS